MEFCYKCDGGVARCLQWTITTWRQLLLFEQTDAAGLSEPNIVFLIINLSILFYGGISSNFCVRRKLLFKSNDDVYIKVSGVVGCPK